MIYILIILFALFLFIRRDIFEGLESGQFKEYLFQSKSNKNGVQYELYNNGRLLYSTNNKLTEVYRKGKKFADIRYALKDGKQMYRLNINGKNITVKPRNGTKAIKIYVNNKKEDVLAENATDLTVIYKCDNVFKDDSCQYGLDIAKIDNGVIKILSDRYSSYIATLFIALAIDAKKNKVIKRDFDEQYSQNK